MKARVALGLLVFGVGCGGYIGRGPAPGVQVARPLKVQIAVLGEQQPLVERALDWVLKSNSLVERVYSGGEGHLLVTSRWTRDVAILAGTDCALRVEVKAISQGGQEVVRETREFRKDQVSSNVPLELEKLATDGVVWALATGVGQLQAAPVAPPPPPVVAAPAVETPPPPPPAPVEQEAPRKKKPRRR